MLLDKPVRGVTFHGWPKMNEFRAIVGEGEATDTDGSPIFVAVVLEKNFAAQGKSPEDAVASLMEMLMQTELVMQSDPGKFQDAWEYMPPAKQEYVDAWARMFPKPNVAMASELADCHGAIRALLMLMARSESLHSLRYNAIQVVFDHPAPISAALRSVRTSLDEAAVTKDPHPL